MAYDVIVIGGGHNGLVAANYLARAGQKVCVLEARHVVGGACVSEEKVPGAIWSSCSFVQGMLRPEVLEELELARFGLRSISPRVQGLALWDNGDHFMLHQDVDRTLASLQAFSPADAKGFFQFGARLKRFCDLSRDWLLSDPPTRSEVFARFEQAGETQLLNEFLTMSAQDLIDSYFTDPRVKGYMLFLAMVSTHGGPQTPTTSYVYGYHAAGEYEGVIGRWAVPVGGMGAITQALKSGLEHFGGTVRTDARVERILTRGGRAHGVRLESGEEVHAGIVLSNAAASTTLTRLLGREALSLSDYARAERIDTRGSMARIHVLIDELPHYVGLPETGGHLQAHTILNASPDLYEEAAEAQRRGTFPDDFVIEALIHSAIDPSVTRGSGKHTLLLGVQQLPIHLKNGTWDDHKEAWTGRVMETMYRFAPNLRGKVAGISTTTPLDLERTYGLPGGNIFQRSMVGLEHLFSERTAPGADSYHTPVQGLYLCGASTHPGGGVTGAPGHNAAHRVLADMAGQNAPVRRHTEISKGFVDSFLASDMGKAVGFSVARSRVMRGATRFFSKVKR